MNQPEESRVSLDQAMRIAVGHRQAGELSNAEQICRQILTSRPTYANAWNLLGVLAHQAGRNDIALDLVNRAIALDPSSADYQSNLGNLLLSDGQLQPAIDAYHRALALKPDLAQTHNNLGSAFNRLGHSEAAIAAHQNAIRLKPDLAEAHSNLANALVDLGHVDEAIASHRAALVLQPDHPQMHWNLATCLLLKGDFENGWREFEWRLVGRDRVQFELQTPQPIWDGNDPAGKTILLRAELGLGDTLQFIRYAGLLHQRGATLAIECQAQLIPLLKQLPHVQQWIAFGQPLPFFDAWCPLMSLPFLLQSTVVPGASGASLLQPMPSRVEYFARRMSGDGRKLKVGLVWAGRPQHLNDRNRSMPFAALRPLLNIPGINWFSLQKGEAAIEARLDPAGKKLMDLTDDLQDFSDTAGLIANLDLVLTVDTAVAHLAGVMGKQTWVMLPFAPDWRWMRDRPETPWYSSMRLIRQSRTGDWAGVIDQAVKLLETIRDRPSLSTRHMPHRVLKNF